MLSKNLFTSGSLYSASGQRKYLTPSERFAFLSAALRNPRLELRSFCLVLAYTGCRISEALALTEQSVECNEEFIAFRCLKKRGSFVVREIPVPKACIRALKRAHILDNLHPKRRLWSWSRSRAWQLVKQVMADAGIVSGIHATPKGLRHGFGIHAVRLGIPLNLVQRWLGHSRLETTAIYVQAMGNEERDIARRMWAQTSPTT